MTGEVSIAGVYMPSLLLLAMIAAALTIALMRLLSFVGAYRLVAYRALVDLALFILVLGLLAWLSSTLGVHQ